MLVFRAKAAASVGAGDGLHRLFRLDAESCPPDVLIGAPSLTGRALAALGTVRADLAALADARAAPTDRLFALPMRGISILAVTPTAADGSAALLGRASTPVAAGPTVEAIGRTLEP